MKLIRLIKKIKKLDINEKKIFGACFLFLVLTCVTICVLAQLVKKENKVEKADFSSVSKICELATLKCYYHNVAEYSKEPDGLFKYGLFQYGYKKCWQEYSGIVKVGINSADVQIDEPDDSNVVKVYVGKAHILDVDADENMDAPIVTTGKFTEVTIEEKMKAFEKAQQTMEKNAMSDGNVVQQATDNAKELIRQYILNVGENIGKEYVVEWVSEPLE